VAIEADVHHRARLQPRKALHLVPLPQAEDAVVVVVAAAGAEERADGVDALVRAAELGEGVRLQTIERVEDERAGLCALYDLGLVKAEAGVAEIVRPRAASPAGRGSSRRWCPCQQRLHSSIEACNDKFITLN
jgi:hypothetical protein